MSDSHTHVLNNGFTTRTSASGRQRTTIVVESEPLIVNTDPKQLGAPVAAAIAEHIRQRILAITASAAASTVARRLRYVGELVRGEPGGTRRYGGGKMGTMAPSGSDRLFNDSGRLAKSIVARAATSSSNEGQWVVNVSANRLDESTFGRGFAAMLQKLSDYVPEIANPKLLLDSLPVQRAIRDGMAGMIAKQTARIAELKEQRAVAIVGIGRQLLSLVG